MVNGILLIEPDTSILRWKKQTINWELFFTSILMLTLLKSNNERLISFKGEIR
jgi:hypothetical protein